MSVKNVLSEEFHNELKELRKLKVGTDEYRIAVEGVTKLADRIIEIEKNEQEASIKEISRQDENELKAAQLEDEKRAQLIRNWIEGIKIVGGLGFAAWAFVASMNFEKEGTLTTEGGRNALRQLLKFVR